MNKHVTTIGITLKRITFFGTLCLLALSSAARLKATVNDIWNDPVGGGSFNTASNWSTSNVPISSTVVVFSGTTPTAASVDSAIAIGSLQFNSTAGGNYSIGGSSVLSIANGITDSSTHSVTISAPLTLTSSQTWNNNGLVTFAVNGAVNLGANNLLLEGPALIGGALTGSGNLSIDTYSSAYTVQFTSTSSTSSFTGSTTVTTGNLFLNSSNVTLNAVTLSSTFGPSTLGVAAGSYTPTIGSLTLTDSTGTANNVSIGSGSTLNLTGNVTYTPGSNNYASTISGAGTLALSGNRTFNIAYNSGGSTDMSISAIVGGTGGITKTGTGSLQLSAANTYSGGTTISSGSIYALNTTGSATGTGALTVAGGNIRGTGTIEGLTTIESGGAIRGGLNSGIGTLTFQNGVTLDSGALLNFDLGSGGNDLIKITGGMLTGDGIDSSIDLAIYAQGTLTAGTYTLVNYTGATESDFNINELTLTNEVAGFNYQVLDTGSAIELEVSAVPEPSTYAIWAGICALGLVALRRRNARKLATAAC